MKSRYSILIQWSNEDHCYIVSLPEFGKYARTHGDTYEEAVKNAQEVLSARIWRCCGHFFLGSFSDENSLRNDIFATSTSPPGKHDAIYNAKYPKKVWIVVVGFYIVCVRM